MAFEYSSFISYRHNDLEDIYFFNLRNFLQPKIFRATDFSKIFYDKESIDWGGKWDEQVYEGIEKSLFFLPLWYDFYLSEKNPWCARELYHALQVEKIIKSNLSPQDQKNFFFIFPLIFLGSPELLPDCFSTTQVKSVVGLERLIKTNILTTKLQEFIDDVYKTLHKHYLILENYPEVDFQSLFQQIKKPTDEEIKLWIREQRRIIKAMEAKILPVLTKNEQ